MSQDPKETRDKLDRLLNDAVARQSAQDRELAKKLQTIAQLRFDVALGITAVFVVGVAAYMRPTAPDDAAVVLLLALLMLFLAAYRTDRINKALGKLARRLSRWKH